MLCLMADLKANNLTLEEGLAEFDDLLTDFKVDQVRQRIDRMHN